MNPHNRSKCVGCGRRNDEADRLACKQCERVAGDNLKALAGVDGLFAMLVRQGTYALTRGGATGGPAVKTSKVHAPSPARDLVVNLLGAGGVVHALQRHASAWYVDLGFNLPVWRGQHHFIVSVDSNGLKVSHPGQLDIVVRTLLNTLPWAAENRDDFGDFGREVRQFVADIKVAIDPTIVKPVQVLVGRCPADLGDGTLCGAKLMADPFAPSIRCISCGTAWGRDRWAELGRTLRTV